MSAQGPCRDPAQRRVVRILVDSAPGLEASRFGVLDYLEPLRHADVMALNAPAPSSIPSARIDDLDLDREEDNEEWRRRLQTLATTRLAAARGRLERLGIIDADGNLVSTELPPDMLPESDTTLETG